MTEESTGSNMKSVYFTLAALMVTLVVTVAGTGFGYGEMSERVSELEIKAVKITRDVDAANQRQWAEIKDNTAITSEINAKLAAVEGKLSLIIEMLRRKSDGE